MDFFYDVPIDLLEAAKQVSGSLTHILKLEVVSKIWDPKDTQFTDNRAFFGM